MPDTVLGLKAGEWSEKEPWSPWSLPPSCRLCSVVTLCPSLREPFYLSAFMSELHIMLSLSLFYG